jgi:L-threonylcarbamoyladenylate synthase
MIEGRCGLAGARRAREARWARARTPISLVATRVLTVDPELPCLGAIDAAVAVLRMGGLVAFPTETFYGLGAAASCESALARIFRAKGRPDDKPLLVLVSSVAMAEMVADVPPAARALMARHWPGALTLVMRARPEVSALITAGTGTIGVRHSPHRIPSALVERLGTPVTAPSANRSGASPPTTARDVVDGLDAELDMVLDGGRTVGGRPSTVVDVTVSPPLVRRQGAVVL